MAFYPDLIGWPTNSPEDWQKAAQYFFTRAAREGTVIPAWYGTYHHDCFGGDTEDAIDIYCYHRESESALDGLTDRPPDNEPYEPPTYTSQTPDHPSQLPHPQAHEKHPANTDDALEVVIHMHMSGPCVWRLEPMYENVNDLPSPYDHTMVVGLDNAAKDTVLPVEIITRHVLKPEEQLRPFLAQMCLLAKSVHLFNHSDDYIDAIQKQPLLALPPGSMIAPAFVINRLQGLDAFIGLDDSDSETLQSIVFGQGSSLNKADLIVEGMGVKTDSDTYDSAIRPDEKLVILCAYVIGYEELELQEHPFLLRIQLATPFGSLTMCSNKAQINKKDIHIGDICYAIGVLSADVAINEYAGGYGN